MNHTKRKYCPLLCIAKPSEQRIRCMGKSCAFCMDYGFGQETCTISGQSIYLTPDDLFKATVYIPINDYDMWNERLADENPDYNNLHIRNDHAPVAEWTANFNADYHALIQIMSGVNGQQLFTRVALYKNGAEHAVVVEKPSHFLQDAYLFSYDGKTFDLQIEKCPF